MGFRLDIDVKSNFYENRVGDYDATKPRWYGGKLYGYCGDEKSLKSGQYLIEIGKLEKDKHYLWTYCCSPDIELTPEQCEIFCKLYIEDAIEQLGFNEKEANKYRKEQLKELDKLVKYGENVILWWG